MRLPEVRVLRPRRIGDAVRMLADHAPHAAVVAGGTWLHPALKRRQCAPTVLISLSRVDGLRGVSADPQLRVGALTTIASLAADRVTPVALAAAAASIASPQIRNMATVGGNLCLGTRCNYYDMSEHWRESVGWCLKLGGQTCRVAPGGARCWAINAADLAPVAVAFGARVRLASPGGDRVVSAAEFFRDDGQRHLNKAADELVVELTIPAAAGLRVAYRKLRQRDTIDFGDVGVAVAIGVDRGGECTLARVVVGSVAPAPLSCTAAEQVLIGARLTPEVIEHAAAEAGKAARPLDNTVMPHYYRKWAIPAQVASALRSLLPNA